jgi:hypothetical protein
MILTIITTGYTCDSITTSFPITLAQLLGWNTWLGTSSAVSDCTKALYANLEYYGRRAVCIGVGSGSGTTTTKPTSTSTTTKPTSSTTKPTSSSSTTTKPTSSTTTSKPSSTTTTKPSSTTSSPPVPTQTGYIPGCQQFYAVQSGDGCWSIQQQFGITFDQFLSWNPSGMSARFTFLVVPNTDLLARTYQWVAIVRISGWAMRIASRGLRSLPSERLTTRHV